MYDDAFGRGALEKGLLPTLLTVLGRVSNLTDELRDLLRCPFDP